MLPGQSTRNMDLDNGNVGPVSGQGSVRYTVVIPIHNEKENLPELERRLSEVLKKLDEPYEVIFVNDGSSDDSKEILERFAERDSRVKVIDLSRNFGHQMALYAGMRRAAGEAVILMDGDLQDPPELIPQLVERWSQGSFVVYAIRQKRKEGFWKRAAYVMYYRLLRVIAYVDLPLDAGDFCLMDRRIVSLLCNMPERNKFLRGLRSWVGFQQSGVVYERDARYAGKTKYTLRKLIKLALDGLISYSYFPLRLSVWLGSIISLCSFALGVFYFFQSFLAHEYIPQGFTTLAVLMLFLGGIQLLSLGLIGEYIGRIYDEVKRRPEYVERELIGFKS